MADVKHTPWTTLDGANSHLFEIRVMAGEKCIAFTDEEYAHLIAAAPTLLEALESGPIIGRFESGQDFKNRQDVWLREVYRPAIALAKGEKVDG